MLTSLRGAHYRSKFLYNFLALLKLGTQYDLRYKIASRYILPAESLIDICLGTGRLIKFLDKKMTYSGVDASPQFAEYLGKMGIPCIVTDLHQGLPLELPAADVIVMIISLSQFRHTSAGQLLESFKTKAKRVVIVEDVLSYPRPENSIVQRTINYLCATDYYLPVTWYTREEFGALMREHGYQAIDLPGRYAVGLYPGQPVKEI